MCKRKNKCNNCYFGDRCYSSHKCNDYSPIIEEDDDNEFNKDDYKAFARWYLKYVSEYND